MSGSPPSAPGAAPAAPGPAAAATSAGPAGAIHDLGYKRYVGTRRPQHTRWQVIARQVVDAAWKGFWRYKAWLLLAIVVTIVVAILMYVRQKVEMGMFGRGGIAITWADGLIPTSFDYYSKAAFLASLTLTSQLIANDMRSGAFTFYFARPVRPFDYLTGKLVGALVLSSLLIALGPVLVALFRIGIAETTDQRIALLPMLPKLLGVGLLGALAYAAIPLGFSALSSSRRVTIAVWAGYYIIATTMFTGLAMLTDPAVAAVDPYACLMSVAVYAIDAQPLGQTAKVLPPPWLGALSLLVQSGLAIGLVMWRVKHEAFKGIGSGS